MAKEIYDIFILEDKLLYSEALDAYSELYNQDKNNYYVWKHFYFFLWTAIEDRPSNFHTKINLSQLLQALFEQGKKAFVYNADFNFIAGYTLSISPYEYGDYEEFEKVGNELLLTATKLEPDNIIYKMVYLGSVLDADQQFYRQAVR